ncbi:2-dehydro-3-deoxy-D-gluconate 5-dehydrogenase KduD [Thermotoga profunda]|uniref:2-dehydro-3-deoxy-D-gluconate 5-dehydrogenase KduD n=1 Tax=Thermotoga profunda TaxID=1508420 RepID=UPI00059763B8|nr:2-dehydro-3-deoxy-D-gluconate 5-dehydrogenase KduD [Thermotoga profunda]
MSVLESFSLSGKVAIVTGASRGLGQAMAIALAEAGANIIGVSSSSDQIETKKIIEKLGREYLELTIDLRDSTKTHSVIEKSIEKFGKVDILINNAGIIRRAPVTQYSEKDWDEVMTVNLKSVFLLSQKFAQHVIERKVKGKIINIASMLSFQGGIFTTAYTVSKHGIVGLTRIFANELAPYGINVNAIAPGYMATKNTEPLRMDENRNKEILSRIPMGRWGDPQDLKGVVVFLASSASDYITGAVIPVDGGWLCR